MADKKISQLTGATTPLAGTEVLPIVQGGNTVKVSVDNLTAGKTVKASTFDTDVAAAKLTVSGITIAAGGTDANVGINLAPKGASGISALAGAPILFSNATNTASGRIYCPGGGSLSFAGYSTEMMRINENTNITAYADVRFNTAGQGIDFSSNTHAAGMTSEKLTWYEEGTWTATLKAGATSAALGTGYYTRIGRLVQIQLNAYSKSMSGVSTSADLYIDGLPFQPKETTVIPWQPNLYSNTTGFFISPDGTFPRLYIYRTNNITDVNTVPLSVFGSPANMTFNINCTYIV